MLTNPLLFSGASIQGKGREYNLQRHKSNYCSARKAAKQNEQSSATHHTSTEAGPSGHNHSINGGSHTGTSGTPPDPLHTGSAMGGAPMPVVMQVYGPVPQSTALPLGMSAGGSGVEV